MKERLFGMIIARSGGTDSPVGYLIPMEEVFRSISLSLSADVRLPSRRDYKLNLLRARQKQHRWLGHSDSGKEHRWSSRLPEVELLLAQIQAEKTGGLARGVLDVHVPDAITAHRRPTNVHMSDYDMSDVDMPGVPMRHVMTAVEGHPLLARRLLPRRHRYRPGFFESTISSVLLLEGVFPIRPNVRAEILSEILRSRKPTHPQLYHQNFRRRDWVVDRFLLTAGGQNILIMLIFLWATFRLPYHQSLSHQTKDELLHRIAEIFTAIFAARGTPASRTPSTSELESLIRVVITVFRFKELPLLMGFYQKGVAKAADPERGVDPRRLDWDALTHSQAKNQEATVVSKLLIQLSLIAGGDRSQVLVCGHSLRSLHIYTGYMLELGTEMRRWHPFTNWQAERLDFGKCSRDPTLVIIYLEVPQELRLNGSELLARDKIDSGWGDQ